MIKSTYKNYLVILLLFVLPIILANQYYVDDIGRATLGYTKWGVDGRPFADLVMSIFNLNLRMADLAPLPLMCSVALLAFVLSMYRIRYLDENKWSFIIPLAFLANPSLVSVFSYRFDVFTFTFAISSAFAVFFIVSRNKFLHILYGAALVSVVMGTYQIVINLVSILIICELFKNVNLGKHPLDIIKTILTRCLQVIIGAVIYFKVILPISFTGEHPTNHPGISGDLFHSIIFNAKSYFNFVSDNFYSVGGSGLILSSLLLMTSLSVIMAWKYVKIHGNVWIAFFIAFLCVASSLLSLPLTMGGLLLLEHPLTGGVHLYMNISGYMLLLATLIYYVSGRMKTISIITLLPVFSAFGLMYAYGNALKIQDVINKQIVSDIRSSTNEFSDNSKYIVFNGEPPRSSVVKNSSLNYPILNYTVLSYFWNWYWSNAHMSINGIQQLYPSSEISSRSINDFCSYKKIFHSNILSSYSNDNVVVIDFNTRECK